MDVANTSSKKKQEKENERNVANVASKVPWTEFLEGISKLRANRAHPIVRAFNKAKIAAKEQNASKKVLDRIDAALRISYAKNNAGPLKVEAQSILKEQGKL